MACIGLSNLSLSFSCPSHIIILRTTFLKNNSATVLVKKKKKFDGVVASNKNQTPHDI